MASARYVDTLRLACGAVGCLASCAAARSQEPRPAPAKAAQVQSRAPNPAGVAMLTRLWPEAMKAVVTSPPELDFGTRQRSQQGRELALLLPEDASCSTVLFDAADALRRIPLPHGPAEARRTPAQARGPELLIHLAAHLRA